MATVECCLSNVSGDARSLLHESEHTVRETLCLDRCGECYRHPFLVVDGELWTGDAHRDIIADFEGGSEARP